MDMTIREKPDVFRPWLTNDEIPLLIRTYVAVCLSESSNISNDDYLAISGWLFNHLRERSPVDSATVMIRVWKSIPAVIADAAIYEKLKSTGWDLPRQLYVTLINQKSREPRLDKSLRWIFAQPAYQVAPEGAKQ